MKFVIKYNLITKKSSQFGMVVNSMKLFIKKRTILLIILCLILGFFIAYKIYVALILIQNLGQYQKQKMALKNLYPRKPCKCY